MLDLIKRIIIFAIGFYAIIFVGRLLFDDFSLKNFTGNIRGAVEDVRSIGQLGKASSTIQINNGSQIGSSGNLSKDTVSDLTKQTGPTATTKGFEKAITLTNLSRGNIVTPGQTIEGTAPGNWFFDGVSTVRFYDEQGSLLGIGQMRTSTKSDSSTPVNFFATAQFTQNFAQTGFVVFEKANVGGTIATAAQFSFPITYPIKNTTNTTQISTTNTTNNQNTQINTTVNNNNSLPIPSPR